MALASLRAAFKAARKAYRADKTDPKLKKAFKKAKKAYNAEKEQGMQPSCRCNCCSQRLDVAGTDHMAPAPPRTTRSEIIRHDQQHGRGPNARRYRDAVGKARENR